MYKLMMNKLMMTKLIIALIAILAIFPGVQAADYPEILPLQERGKLIDQWLKIRLDTVVPEVMRRAGIDMWLVICREYNEDPVFMTMVPSHWFSARRTTMLVFYLDPKKSDKNQLERLIIRPYSDGEFYEGAWPNGRADQWDCLADIVAERNPQHIGINESDDFAFADGLTASLKARLITTLGPKYSKRLRSAEKAAIDWLGKRIPQEMELYPHIVSIAHAIIAEAFSNRVITPGQTTLEDVGWWMRLKIRELGLKAWFHPYLTMQRPGEPGEPPDNIIRRGDLLHCDLGLTYLRLNTDTQEMAYVLKENETDAPPGLKAALRLGNRLQDIVTNEFKTLRTGNRILLRALAKAKSENINAQVYTHPVGFYGHGAGTLIGLWDQQEGVPGKGDYPLQNDTCHALELNIRTPIPEWKNQTVGIMLEQDIHFTGQEVRYLDGRQTHFHIIK